MWHNFRSEEMSFKRQIYQDFQASTKTFLRNFPRNTRRAVEEEFFLSFSDLESHPQLCLTMSTMFALKYQTLQISPDDEEQFQFFSGFKPLLILFLKPSAFNFSAVKIRKLSVFEAKRGRRGKEDWNIVVWDDSKRWCKLWWEGTEWYVNESFVWENFFVLLGGHNWYWLLGKWFQLRGCFERLCHSEWEDISQSREQVNKTLCKE